MKKLIFLLWLLLPITLTGDISILKEAVNAFSPNNDGIQEHVLLDFETGDTVYEELGFEVYNRKKELLHEEVLPGDSEIRQFLWSGKDPEGKTYSEGSYTGVIYGIDTEGERKEKRVKLTLDVTPPRSSLKGEPALISPNYDGISDTYPVEQSGSKENLWTGVFYNSRGKAVRTYKWRRKKPGDFKWDGFSDYGRKVPDGEYSYTLTSVDEAGNRSPERVITGIMVDGSTPRISVAAGLTHFSPNGDGVQDIIPVTFKMEARDKVLSVQCEVIHIGTGETFTLTDEFIPSSEIRGQLPGGEDMKEGIYTLVFSVEYENGYRAVDSLRFHLRRTAPSVTLNSKTLLAYKEGEKSYGKLLYTLEGGESDYWADWSLEIRAGEKSVISWQGSKNPDNEFILETEELQGEYTARLIMTDLNGNSLEVHSTSEPFVYLKKVRGQLYYDVPSVYFEPYGTEANDANFSEIINILNRDPSLKVILESHSNNDGNNALVLLELSEKRALSIKRYLMELGVADDRIGVNALGVSAPVSESDEGNRCVLFRFE